MHVRSCVCFLSLLDRDGNENVKKAILESANIYRFQRSTRSLKFGSIKFLAESVHRALQQG